MSGILARYRASIRLRRIARLEKRSPPAAAAGRRGHREPADRNAQVHIELISFLKELRRPAPSVAPPVAAAAHTPPATVAPVPCPARLRSAHDNRLQPRDGETSTDANNRTAQKVLAAVSLLMPDLAVQSVDSMSNGLTGLDQILSTSFLDH